MITIFKSGDIEIKVHKEYILKDNVLTLETTAISFFNNKTHDRYFTKDKKEIKQTLKVLESE